MAAPHVAGAAALLAGAMPALTPAQIEEAFQTVSPASRVSRPEQYVRIRSARC